MKLTIDALQELWSEAGAPGEFEPMRMLFMVGCGRDGINDKWDERMEYVALLDGVALAFRWIECDAAEMACGDKSIAVACPRHLYARALQPDGWIHNVARRAKAFAETHTPPLRSIDNPLLDLEEAIAEVQGWIANGEHPSVDRTRVAVYLANKCSRLCAVAIEWRIRFLSQELLEAEPYQSQGATGGNGAVETTAPERRSLPSGLPSWWQDAESRLLQKIYPHFSQISDGLQGVSAKMDYNIEITKGAKDTTRKSEDIVKFCKLVDELTTMKDGHCQQLDTAIDEAWKLTPALPQNLSHQRKKADYDLWDGLKKRLKRDPTVGEYEAARARRGRPPRKKSSPSEGKTE